MKNYFMSESERQERTDKRWTIATLSFGIMGIIYLTIAMCAMEIVQDSWSFVALGAVSSIGVLVCMFRDIARRA